MPWKQYRDTLMETVAETSEEFMDRYFSGDTFSEAEIRSAVRVNIQDGSIVPVECGASNICRGVYTLLDDIVKYMPSADNRSVNGINMHQYSISRHFLKTADEKKEKDSMRLGRERLAFSAGTRVRN